MNATHSAHPGEPSDASKIPDTPAAWDATITRNAANAANAQNGTKAAGAVNHLGALGADEPRIHPEAWLAPGTVVVGKVTLGRASSVWYGSVLRGDDEEIVVGAECNIQDLCCLHSDPGQPAILEDRVSLGHKAMVHGAHVETGSLIGIGAIVLGGAHIGSETLVAAGALIGPGKRIPSGVLVAGVPGKVVRELTDEDKEIFAYTADSYVRKMERHRAARWLSDPS